MAEQTPHYPTESPIEAYGAGGFRFAGMSHRGSIACTPSGIYGWRPSSFLELTAADFDIVCRHAESAALVLIGTGQALQPLPGDLQKHLREAGLRPEVMDTGAACRTYNVLLAEHRPVAAMLLQVD
jgi:uncharacterized protein